MREGSGFSIVFSVSKRLVVWGLQGRRRISFASPAGSITRPCDVYPKRRISGSMNSSNPAWNPRPQALKPPFLSPSWMPGDLRFPESQASGSACRSVPPFVPTLTYFENCQACTYRLLGVHTMSWIVFLTPETS